MLNCLKYRLSILAEAVSDWNVGRMLQSRHVDCHVVRVVYLALVSHLAIPLGRPSTSVFLYNIL